MRKLYISNPGVFWFCNRLFLLNTWSKTSWKVIYKNIHVCPSFAGGYNIEMKNIEKWMKRNQFYAELLKMGLSWSINASNNPCSKDCKTKTGQPRQLFFNALSWASHTPADPLTFLLPKKDHNNEHLCSKGQGELIISSSFTVMSDLKACCHSDVLADGRFQAASYLWSSLAKLWAWGQVCLPLFLQETFFISSPLVSHD